MLFRSPAKVLKYFSDNFDKRVKEFGGSITKTDGKTTAGVTSDYRNYKAPKTFVGAAPAKKMGGAKK